MSVPDTEPAGALATDDQIPWWQRGAVYQIYPRSFADADGDGVGDLRGVTNRLDYLRDLGVEALWLSPFFPSPMADNGYDVADYCDVDPRFGTLADFDELVSEAHARGLHVVIDWVPNHTSDQHPWFRDPGKKSWYVWRDEPANAWRSEFKRVGSAWTRDEQTGQWYLHSFLPQQPDLNWDEPRVEAAMHEVLRFWLQRGVDGFRIDVAFKLGKDPALGENEPGRRHDQDWPTIHPRFRAIRRVLDEFDERMAVGELYLPSQRDLAAYVTSGDELHMAHNFFLLLAPWVEATYRHTIAEWLELLEPDAWPAWCLGNHDHSRLASRLGPERARTAAMLLITLRGTPFIYQGDELGLEDVPMPPEFAKDIDGRDPERAPIPWRPPSQAGPGAGFTCGSPWLPITADAEEVNAARQREDPRSMLALYRQLLTLRRAEPALRSGSMRLLDAGPDVLAYTRGDEFLVLLSFVSEPRVAAIPAPGMIEISTNPDREKSEQRSPVQLGPDEGVLLRMTSNATSSFGGSPPSISAST